MTPGIGPVSDASRPVVLVVDDEAATRRAYVRVLDRAGLETCEAVDGRDALNQLTSRSVDAVVLDQQMPGMTGMDLIAAIRALSFDDRTPVLFVSGDGSPEMRIRALRAGASDFMVKPVVLAELVARVEAQLRVSATWTATVRKLSRRSEAIAALADLGPSGDPASTADLLCERISQAQDGAPCGIYESRIDGTQFRLASLGHPPAFLSAAADPLSAITLRQQVRGVPWVEQEPLQTDTDDRRLWWACAPLRRESTSLGILVLGGWARAGDVAAVDQLLAAAVDYAAVATLHLGLGLTDALTLRIKRDALRLTLTDRAYWPVFQPIVRLDDGGPIGYEALTRFRDGVAPDQRLADAAAVGLAADMELAMLSAAIEQSEGLLGDVWLSVNVSPSVLIERNAELVALVASSPHPLVVELTEHNPIDDYAIARSALARLGSKVRLSVDDAGAGFASLRHVIDLHPQFLKLDRSWVSGIQHDDARQALIAGLVGFATRTGTDMIAEGIETNEEKATLEQLRVPYGQGYLLGRPQPLSDLDQ